MHVEGPGGGLGSDAGVAPSPWAIGTWTAGSGPGVGPSSAMVHRAWGGRDTDRRIGTRRGPLAGYTHTHIHTHTHRWGEAMDTERGLIH